MALANTAPRKRKREDFRLIAKTRLLERGLNVTELAHALGLARNTVSIAINHPTMLPTVKRRIRDELKMPLS